MAIIKISKKDLCSLANISTADVEPILTEIGIPIDKDEDGQLHLEITPNRPDWLSVEGVARAAASYKHGKPKKYVAKNSKIEINVDSSTKKIRPYFGGAYVTNAKLDEKTLESLIQLQEKLHDTLGRNRKKMAIGIHDAKNISPPFTYKTVSPDEIKFIPLSMGKELTCSQILSQHEKGKKYAHLIKDKCPIIIDKNNKVLSFPPIINGELTKLTSNSKDLFIDCTGTHEDVVNITVNIICAALADRGAQIHSIKINSKKYPLFQTKKTLLNLKKTNKILGTNMDLAEAKKHLHKMGHELQKNHVLSPAYRSDILHPIDITEDIAISIGFNNFKPQLPDFCTIGNCKDYSFLHQTCLGLGFFEVSSWILTNQKVLEKSKINPKECLRVQNPLTQEFTTMRPALYPNMLEIFSNSKSQSMPQNLYEFGPIIKSQKNNPTQHSRLCFASASPKSNFSQIHSYLKAFLDVHNTKYTLIASQIDGFIPSRCAKVLINSKEVGIIGEIHPEVLESFAIEQPVCIFELDSKFLK